MRFEARSQIASRGGGGVPGYNPKTGWKLVGWETGCTAHMPVGLQCVLGNERVSGRVSGHVRAGNRAREREAEGGDQQGGKYAVRPRRAYCRVPTSVDKKQPMPACGFRIVGRCMRQATGTGPLGRLQAWNGGHERRVSEKDVGEVQRSRQGPIGETRGRGTSWARNWCLCGGRESPAAASGRLGGTEGYNCRRWKLRLRSWEGGALAGCAPATAES